MTDYGRPLAFGFFLNPNAAEYSGLIQTAQLVDDLGLDLIGIQDHPYQSTFLDTWTLLTAIATQTRRVGVVPHVANLPLRPPPVLSQAAAPLHVLSRGRGGLCLGARGAWGAT